MDLRSFDPFGVVSQCSEWERGTECPTALRGRSQFIIESASNGGEGMSQLVTEDGTFHTYRLSKLRSDDLRRDCLERLDFARGDSILSKQINLRDTAQRRVARRCMLRSCDKKLSTIRRSKIA